MYCGIKGAPLKWLSSYLSGRQDHANYHITRSANIFIKCGVSQGSIIGPLVFLVFIDDFYNFSSIFADDFNLLIPGYDVEHMFKTMNE